MLILGIDTTAVAASVGLIEKDSGKIVFSGTLNTKQTHSQTLLPLMESLLKNAGVAVSDIDLFSVANGPGSFTGLRISVSAVKGIAFGLNKPVCGVSTLKALAYNLTGIDCIACPVMDARCGQVYNALFRIENGNVTRLTPDRAITITDLAKELADYRERVILNGDGAELFEKAAGVGEIAPPLLLTQNGASVAFSSIDEEQIAVNQLMPSYLRLPQAERERLEREEKEKNKEKEGKK